MKNYLREDLKDFKPYDADEKPCRYKMDANESPWDLPSVIRKALAEELIEGSGFNRYPDSNATQLRKAIGEYWGLSHDQIVIGAGSDELIQIILTGFVEKGDRVLMPVPSFGMYRVFTLMAGGIPMEAPLGEGYKYDIHSYDSALSKGMPKVIFICSPNNPTGNTIDPKGLKDFIKGFPGIVVVDEAYGEFTRDTMIRWTEELPNLLVLRTFSKAFGLAGLRVGYSVSSRELADQINRVKPPYNVNSFSQKAAIKILENKDIIKGRVDRILEERERVYRALDKIKDIQVYPSEANFLLIKVPCGDAVWQGLYDKGILTRNFSNNPYLKDCLRVTVAQKEANDSFLKALEEVLGQL
jgi:histidinol-phosphate aminotransferase